MLGAGTTEHPLIQSAADARSLLDQPPAAAGSTHVRKVGTVGTLLQIFRLYCGTGLLAFPYAVKCGGLIAAPVAVLLIGFLNNQTLRMLVLCKQHLATRVDGVGPRRGLTLDDIAYAAFGKMGRSVCAGAMFVSLSGLCAGYLIFVGTTLRSGFGEPSWADVPLFSGLRGNLCTVIATACVWPLTLIRDYARVQWSGVVGNVTLLAAVGIIMYHVIDIIWFGDVSSNATPSPAPAGAGLPKFNESSFPIFLGLVFFSFAIQSVILGVEAAAAHPDRFIRDLNVGGGLGIGLFVVFGVLCYYAYGATTSQIIFQSVGTTTDVRVVEILFCVSMVLLYPLQMVPVVQIVERWVLPRPQAEPRRVGTAFSPPTPGTSWTATADAETTDTLSRPHIRTDGGQTAVGGIGTGPRGGTKSLTCKQFWIRTGMTLLTGAFALVFGPMFSQILSLVGALGFSTISFILPPLIYLRIFSGNLSLHERLVAYLIFLIGCAGIVTSTFVDLQSIIAYFEGTDSSPC